MKLAEVGQHNAQKSGHNWARASDKRIMPALPQYGGRLQVAMFAAQPRLEKKVQLVSCHPDSFSLVFVVFWFGISGYVWLLIPNRYHFLPDFYRKQGTFELRLMVTSLRPPPYPFQKQWLPHWLSFSIVSQANVNHSLNGFRAPA